MINGKEIKSKRKSLGWSAATLAVALNVKEDNIYKWEKGTKISDPEQYIRVEEWLKSGKLENVPRVTRSKAIGDPLADEHGNLRDKHIALLERENARLQKDLDLSLGELRHNVLLTRAMSETTQELLLELLAKQNKKNWDDLAADVGIRNGEKYLKLKEEGNFAYVGK